MFRLRATQYEKRRRSRRKKRFSVVIKFPPSCYAVKPRLTSFAGGWSQDFSKRWLHTAWVERPIVHTDLLLQLDLPYIRFTAM